MAHFIFGSVDSRTYSVNVFDVNTENAAPQVYESKSVPGRNGDILMRMKRYPNREQRYDCIIASSYAANLQAFKAALFSAYGYQRLEDTYHPNEFYIAAIRSAFEVTKDRDSTLGKFTVVFDCKPQRFLKTGETVQNFTSSGTITNPTSFDAIPLLRVYGTGTLGIGDYTLTITAADTYTDIDCELMEAYKGVSPHNDKVKLINHAFPVLKPGSNGVSLGTGITKVQITPRWWTL